MSYLENITQTQQTTTDPATTKTTTADIMGKEDFLTLLVTQLQNQDPLNPDDPTEFTAQLAQFSSLEQLFNLNDSMKNLVTSNANSDKFATLQTIGKEVVFQSNKFEYEGESQGEVNLGYKIDGAASEVTINIMKNGATIATVEGSELSSGNHFATWDGLDSDGNPVEAGSYTFSISAKAAEGETVAASPLIRSEVTGVDLTGDYGGNLTTKAGEVSFASILGVYEKEDKAPEEPPADEEKDPFGSFFR